MELKDFAGVHELNGVDFIEIGLEWGNHASVCRFKLDGKVYCAAEDPDDGYRSCLSNIYALPDDISLSTSFSNTVKAEYIDNGTDELIVFKDYANGEVVLEIGTVDYDDYYPCFVASFTPESMQINKS